MKEILNMKMSLEQRAHLSATLKARGIQPSEEARRKAIEINKSKPKKPPESCKIEGCEKLVDSKGLCKQCYDKERRKDPNVAARRKARDREKLAKDPDFYKRGNIRRYGVTLEQYYDAVAYCYGQCEICENVPNGSGRNGILHVDHCHETGALKGLLCMSCNTALGLMDNDIKRLKSAKQYLIFNGAKEETEEIWF